jgi:hypothetical protein
MKILVDYSKKCTRNIKDISTISKAYLYGRYEVVAYMKLGQNYIRLLSLWTDTSEKQSLESQDE